MRTWQSSEEPSTRDGAMRRGGREASIGDFRQSRRQRLRNAEAAERSLQGEIAREIRRRWRVAYMGDLRQARRDEEMRMR